VVSEVVEGSTSMLAEKFFLVLETIISRRDPDEAPFMRNSRHVPVRLPANDFLSRRSGNVLHTQRSLRSTWARVPEEKPMRRDVLSKLANLPDDQRAVLLLVAVEDLSYSAAANVLNISTSAVMSCLSQAREKLRRENEGHADVTSSNIIKLRALK
jgi:predicted DNA-binding protein (UPF0251 family)